MDVERDKEGKSGAPTLQTVERALMFLEYVADCKEPPVVQKVSEALGLNITTTYHLMRTLAKRNYIKRLTGGKLQIGDAIAPLFRSYRLRLNVNQEFNDIVRTLSEKTGETTFFSALSGESVILEILVEGSQPLRVGGLFVGSTGYEHRRASSRAILPFLEKDRREAILRKSLSSLPKGEAAEARRSFEEAAEKVRERGWSTDGGDIVQGVSGIGWPVFDGYGGIYGAVGVIMPTLRLERSRDAVLAEISAAADQATEILKNSMTG